MDDEIKKVRDELFQVELKIAMEKDVSAKRILKLEKKEVLERFRCLVINKKISERIFGMHR